jgi:FKBP-type peptidyl-prolyl cis-trans isomerase SlyD
MMRGMLIQAPCVVSLTWRLEDTQGQLIDALDQPLDFLVGGDDLLAKVEDALAEQSVGFEATLHLEPEVAFGDYDAELVFFEARSIFPEEIEVGMQFDGPPPGSATPNLSPAAIYTITEIYDAHVVLDGNHPLAGMALVIQLKVHGVRAASPEEIANRSVAESPVTVLGSTSAGQTLH